MSKPTAEDYFARLEESLLSPKSEVLTAERAMRIAEPRRIRREFPRMELEKQKAIMTVFEMIDW